MPVFSLCVTVRTVCRFPGLLFRDSSEYNTCMTLPGDSERGPQHEAQRKSGENRRSHRQGILPLCLFRKSSAGSRNAAQQRGQKYQEKDGFNARKVPQAPISLTSPMPAPSRFRVRKERRDAANMVRKPAVPPARWEKREDRKPVL